MTKANSFLAIILVLILVYCTKVTIENQIFKLILIFKLLISKSF